LEGRTSSYDTAATALVAANALTGNRGWPGFALVARLKAIVWILLGVSSFFFLGRCQRVSKLTGKYTYVCKQFPLFFDVVRFCSPKLPCYLRDLRIGESRMLSDNALLMPLSIEDESCTAMFVRTDSHQISLERVPFKKRLKECGCGRQWAIPFLGRGILVSG
jgi:hypothetical protein